jgi:hypothetical protein
MLSNRQIKAPLLWCLLACLLLTGVVWLLGQRLGWNHLFEVTWIPIIEYGLVAIVAGLVWAGLKVADAGRGT